MTPRVTRARGIVSRPFARFFLILVIRLSALASNLTINSALGAAVGATQRRTFSRRSPLTDITDQGKAPAAAP